MDETANNIPPVPASVTPCTDVGRIIIVFPVRDAQKAIELRQGIVDLLREHPEAQITFTIANLPGNALPPVR